MFPVQRSSGGAGQDQLHSLLHAPSLRSSRTAASQTPRGTTRNRLGQIWPRSPHPPRGLELRPAVTNKKQTEQEMSWRPRVGVLSSDVLTVTDKVQSAGETMHEEPPGREGVESRLSSSFTGITHRVFEARPLAAALQPAAAPQALLIALWIHPVPGVTAAATSSGRTRPSKGRAVTLSSPCHASCHSALR